MRRSSFSSILLLGIVLVGGSSAAQAATASFEIRGYVPLRCSTAMVDGQPTVTCNSSDVPQLNFMSRMVAFDGGAGPGTPSVAPSKNSNGGAKLASDVAGFAPLTVVEITL